MTLKKKTFENVVGKGENAGYQAFSFFPTMFSNHPEKNFMFFSYIYFVICECFQFWPVQKFAIRKGLILGTLLFNTIWSAIREVWIP